MAKPALGVVGDCASTDAVCLKWQARYAADRPHLTGAAAATPIFLAYGGKDTTIQPSLMKCALDRLADEATKLTTCVDPDQDHGGIVSATADRVGDFIASVALNGPPPAACAQTTAAVSVPCFEPPPNKHAHAQIRREEPALLAAQLDVEQRQHVGGHGGVVRRATGHRHRARLGV